MAVNPSETKLLIVDDDPDLLEAISELFVIFGFQTKTAQSAKLALQVLNKEAFDIVISDIRMPEMTGAELLKRIKQKNPLSPKVLMISGFSDFSERELYALGADGFFSKPFDASSVREALTTSLLEPELRLSQPLKVENALVVKKSFGSFEEMLNSSEVSMGRLGLFLQMKENLPHPEDWVEFQIDFKDSRSFAPRLQGVGQVRWQRSEENNGQPSGIGVLIKYLEPECLKPWSDYIKQAKSQASIPIK